MDIEPGARGIVIGDRYRVAGALRRTGLIDAVDLEGERGAAACRVVAVPGDAERVDQWEDAWRAAQEAARLPRLREIVDDGEGGHWAVLDGSPATGLRLPPDARHQAALIGEALARTGLDVGDVTRGMLVARADDLLVLDGGVWLGGELSPRAAGSRVADLLPLPEPVLEYVDENDAPPPPPARRAAARRRLPRRRRMLIPLAMVAAALAATLVLVLPAGSAGTGVQAPAATAEGALLVAGDYPAVVPPVVPPLATTVRAEPAVVTVTTERMVTVVVTDVVVAESATPAVEPVPVPTVPVAAPAVVPAAAPALPLAAPALPSPDG
jgi:hypothetical protein